MEPTHTRGISPGKFISELGSSAPLLHASMYFIGCSACPGNITAPVDWYTKLTKCATSGCLRVVFVVVVVVVVVEVMTRQLYLAIVQPPVMCASMFSTSFSERESVNRPWKTIPAIIDRIRFLQTIRANESQIVAWQLNMLRLMDGGKLYLRRRLIGWWWGYWGSLSCETTREND